MNARRFVARFPGVKMPEHLGGQRAIVILSSKPTGADDNLVLATCMDINGRMHANVPFSMAAIRYAAANGAITFVETTDGGLSAPLSGLVGLDGKKLL